MASLFGHLAIALATKESIVGLKESSISVYLLGILCTVIPDFDIIGFTLGVPYESIWGHRGFTHSFIFAVLFALLLVIFAHKKLEFSSKSKLFNYYFICTMSHGILDMFTNGGLGVGLLIPFDDTRYFAPIRPILVSPIGMRQFFSSWGMSVLVSELFWIGIPCATFYGLTTLIKRIK